MENQAVSPMLSESDFWKQMYQETASGRNAEHARAEKYKAMAMAAERRYRKLRNILLWTGMILACVLNAYWISQIVQW